MADTPQELRPSREEELVNVIKTALNGIERRNQPREHESRIPDLFAEIIKIFEETRNKIFHAIDMDGEHHLSMVVDLSQEAPELRLNITTDKRGKITKWLGIKIDQITTKILVLTNEGYRITTAADLEKHRFITGGIADRLRIAKYGPNSIMPILEFLKRFHHLIQQATSQP